MLGSNHEWVISENYEILEIVLTLHYNITLQDSTLTNPI